MAETEKNNNFKLTCIVEIDFKQQASNCQKGRVVVRQDQDADVEDVRAHWQKRGS